MASHASAALPQHLPTTTHIDVVKWGGGALTWLTDRGEYGSPISPGQPLEPASDKTLELLRGYYRDRERFDV